MRNTITWTVVLVMIASFATGCCCVGKKPQIIESAPPSPAPVQTQPMMYEEPVSATPAPSIEAAPVPVKPLPAPVILDLRQLAGQYPNLLSLDEATGRLRFSADLTFDSGSNVVKPEARAALTKLGGILTAAAARELQVDIVGYTDSVPVRKAATIALLKKLQKSTSNQGLSEARAEAVADVLKAIPVDAARMTTKGAGETQPIADNATAEGRARNRRVEVFMFAR